MQRIALAAVLTLASTLGFAQMMGHPSGPISTSGYFPLVDGARYEYVFTRGPWSSAIAHMRSGQTWSGITGLTAMHMTFTCVPGVQCAPDSTDFYRMDPDGVRYFGGTGSDPHGSHFSMMAYSSPEWLLRNPVTPGTMMGGGMYQNAGSWHASVMGSGSMMGGLQHMSTYRALALETVTTPAGTFEVTLHVREERGSGYLRDVWYAPNVGMVMMVDATVTMMLTGYTIPGGVAQPGGGAAPLAFTPVTGMWWNPNESGSGYNVQVQRGTLVMTMFTYGTAGEPMWYLGVGSLANAGEAVRATGTLDKYRDGQCLMCGYRPPARTGDDGSFIMTFTSPNDCVLQLPGGRTVTIQPMGW